MLLCYKLLVPRDIQREMCAVVLTEAGCDCCVTLHEIVLPDLKIYEPSVVLHTFYFPLNIFGGGWQESYPAANGNKMTTFFLPVSAFNMKPILPP